MRGFRLLAIAAVAGAVPGSLHAAADSAELNCVFSQAARADIEAAWSARHQYQTPPAAASAAMDRIAVVTRGCVAQYHWTEARAEAAITYAIARVNFEDALSDLEARGVSPEVYQRIAADLGERGRTALENGDTGNGNFDFIGETVARDLAAAHVPVRSGSPELIGIARALAHALSAQRDVEREIDAFTTS